MFILSNRKKKSFTYTLHEDALVLLSSDNEMNIRHIFREAIDPSREVHRFTYWVLFEPPIYSFLDSPRPILVDLLIEEYCT